VSRYRPSGKAGIGVQGRKAIPGDDVALVMGEAERKAKNTGRPSEFSHGSGLVSSGFADTPPSRGGQYNPISPRVNARVGRGEGSAGRRIRQH
jgi:hypothetical protein